MSLVQRNEPSYPSVLLLLPSRIPEILDPQYIPLFTHVLAYIAPESPDIITSLDSHTLV